MLSSTVGSLPASITVSVDPSQLSTGTSTGHITIVSPLTAVPSTTVNVIANISSAIAPSLALSTSAVNLSIIRGPQGALESTGTFTILNTGGGTVTATVGNPPVPWLTTSAASPLSVTPNSPVDVTLTTTSSALASGTYSTQITVNGGAAGSVTLPVTLTIVDARPKIQLSQVGMTFAAVAQGGAPLPQSFGILNSGQGSMPWAASVSTLSGGAGWLSIDQTNGTVATPVSGVSTVNVTVNPSGLAAGDYYGQVQIKVQGADNSPQIVSVVLNVAAAGTHLGPAVSPTALTFVGSAASAPGSQIVLLGNLGASPITFQSTLTTDTPGTPWLQYAPVSATVNPGQPAKIRGADQFCESAGRRAQRQPDICVLRWIRPHGKHSDRGLGGRRRLGPEPVTAVGFHVLFGEPSDTADHADRSDDQRSPHAAGHRAGQGGRQLRQPVHQRLGFGDVFQ